VFLVQYTNIHLSPKKLKCIANVQITCIPIHGVVSHEQTNISGVFTFYALTSIICHSALQSILCDINLLTADGEWNTEDRLALESQLVLATQGPLCLDPSPAVSIVNNHMQYHRRALSTEPLRRCAKKFSQVMQLIIIIIIII